MSHQSDNIFAGTQVVSLVEIRRPGNSLAHRDCLLAVKRGELALTETKLPDYGVVNRFLIKARRTQA
jgi:hypothetical protein